MPPEPTEPFCEVCWGVHETSACMAITGVLRTMYSHRLLIRFINKPLHCQAFGRLDGYGLELWSYTCSQAAMRRFHEEAPSMPVVTSYHRGDYNLWWITELMPHISYEAVYNRLDGRPI